MMDFWFKITPYHLSAGRDLSGCVSVSLTYPLRRCVSPSAWCIRWDAVCLLLFSQDYLLSAVGEPQHRCSLALGHGGSSSGMLRTAADSHVIKWESLLTCIKWGGGGVLLCLQTEGKLYDLQKLCRCRGCREIPVWPHSFYREAPWQPAPHFALGG